MNPRRAYLRTRLFGRLWVLDGAEYPQHDSDHYKSRAAGWPETNGSETAAVGKVRCLSVSGFDWQVRPLGGTRRISRPR